MVFWLLGLSFRFLRFSVRTVDSLAFWVLKFEVFSEGYALGG